jgi:NAD(P)-dependent dehydrogenase (short-subunit alcohol dehydrogenase family)
MRPFAGHTALVTGAGRRIGATIATRLAQAGCDVVVHHHDSAAEAKEVCTRIRQEGVQAFAVRADLAKAAERRTLLDQAEALAGRPVRFLVNNASAFPRATFEGLKESGLEEAIKVNAWAPFDLLRELHARTPRCDVVNLLDARLHDADREHVGYHLSKVLLAELTRLGALMLAPKMRVNGVSPGPVLASVDSPAGTPGPTGKGLPLRRPPTPDDIADAVLYLLAAPAVTGAVIPVDGGRHLVGPSA